MINVRLRWFQWDINTHLLKHSSWISKYYKHLIQCFSCNICFYFDANLNPPKTTQPDQPELYRLWKRYGLWQPLSKMAKKTVLRVVAINTSTRLPLPWKYEPAFVRMQECMYDDHMDFEIFWRMRLAKYHQDMFTKPQADHHEHRTAGCI